MLSSTGNDQLSQFDLNISSLSLTSKSGKTVNLVTTTQNPEFIHLNGKLEPLLTVSVPQDVYTAATATIGTAMFTCVTLDSSTGGLVTSMYAYGSTPNSQVTVNLPAPITVTGDVMGLSLDLQVSSSATFPSSCYVQGIPSFSINPTFNLTPVAFPPQLAERGLDGQVVSINAADNSFSLALAGGMMSSSNSASANGPMVSFRTNGSTVYQGLSGLSALAVGALVDMDAAIQSDGSQLATRIAIEDTDLTNLSVSTGPLTQVAGSQPTLFAFGRQNQGYLWTTGQAGNFMPYSFGSALFQISEVANLQALPFVPSFNPVNMFDGQNVYVSSHATTLQGGPTYFPATTITLVRQAINGTISGSSTDGSFTTYNVTLASYDLIPTLAVQAGQTTVLTDPTNVVVYVDSQTQLLNKQALAVGSVMRFNGLLFNDNGILRMDCLQVNDGVGVQPAQAAPAAGSSFSSQQGVVATHVFRLNDLSQPRVMLYERFGTANFLTLQHMP